MEIVHKEDKGFFIEDKESNVIAELTYERKEGKLYFNHTYVSPDLRGQGVADRLLEAGVGYAEQKGYKIVPVCSYIVKKFEDGTYDHIKG